MVYKDLASAPKSNVELNTNLVLIGIAINILIYNSIYLFSITYSKKMEISNFLKNIGGFSPLIFITGFSSIVAFAIIRLYALQKWYGRKVIKWNKEYDKKYITPAIIDLVLDQHKKQKLIENLSNPNKREQTYQKLFYDFIGDHINELVVSSNREKFYERASALWTMITLELIIIMGVIINIFIFFILYYGKKSDTNPISIFSFIMIIIIILNKFSQESVKKEMSRYTLRQINYIKDSKMKEFNDALEKI